MVSLLIADLLDMSRIISGKLRLDVHDVDLIGPSGDRRLRAHSVRSGNRLRVGRSRSGDRADRSCKLRRRALNRDTLGEGNAVLEKYVRLNGIFNKEQYTNDDKNTITR
jgi:hypothetical protein